MKQYRYFFYYFKTESQSWELAEIAETMYLVMIHVPDHSKMMEQPSFREHFPFRFIQGFFFKINQKP